jgi:hypothetical protein
METLSQHAKRKGLDSGFNRDFRTNYLGNSDDSVLNSSIPIYNPSLVALELVYHSVSFAQDILEVFEVFSHVTFISVIFSRISDKVSCTCLYLHWFGLQLSGKDTDLMSNGCQSFNRFGTT